MGRCATGDEDGRLSPDYGFGGMEVDDEWGVPIVDSYSYNRVRDTIQSKWIAFAYGESPWSSLSPASSSSKSREPEKVFVFGPEGETGERSLSIFDGRRRRRIWKEALEPLGMSTVQKVGVELCNGPPEAVVASVGVGAAAVGGGGGGGCKVKIGVKMNLMKMGAEGEGCWA